MDPSLQLAPLLWLVIGIGLLGVLVVGLLLFKRSGHGPDRPSAGENRVVPAPDQPPARIYPALGPDGELDLPATGELLAALDGVVLEAAAARL